MTRFNPIKGTCHQKSQSSPFLAIAGIVFTIIMIVGSSHGYAQGKKNPAVEKAPKEHSIAKAAIFSAVLPGLGQAYNRKYWKIPIIYAGFGVITYFVISNNNEYKDYREAYVYTANGDTFPTNNPYVGRYTLSQLQEGMDFYRRNRDLSYIVGGIWYIANILEAYVDAHFFNYDISDDLTLRVSPAVSAMPSGYYQPVPGFRISLKF